MVARIGAVFCRACLTLACAGVAASSVLLGLCYPGLAILAFVGMIWRRRRLWGGSGWAHGTARIADVGDLMRGGLLADKGLIFGRTAYLEPPTKLGAVGALISPRVDADEAVRLFLAAFFVHRFAYQRMIRLNKFTHVACFAPSGSGKGVSLAIPTCLSYEGSMVITDPKGELFLKSAAHRRSKFGHQIVLFDPFGICKEKPRGIVASRFNPLLSLDPNAVDFIERCRDLANMLVVRAGTEPDPYWCDMAEQVIAAFVQFVRICEPDPKKQTLDTVRSLVSSRHRFNRSLDVMQKSTELNGLIARAGHGLTHAQSDELGSILSSVQRHMSFLDSVPITEHLSETTFDPAKIRDGKVTVYLCIPGDKLEILAPLMRTWIGCLLRAATRDHEKNPVLFLLDEAGHLGKLKALENAVTLMRGMGIRLYFFFQSLGQLKHCFGENASTVLDNLDTQIFFGTNAYEHAEAISKRIGDMTILTDSLNETTGRNYSDDPGQPAGGSRSRSLTYSEHGRAIWNPTEVLRLEDEMALLFHRNLSVVPVKRLRYYDDAAFKNGRCGETPSLGIRAIPRSVACLLASAAFLASVLVLPVAQTRQALRPAVSPAISRPTPRPAVNPAAVAVPPAPVMVPAAGLPADGAWRGGLFQPDLNPAALQAMPAPVRP